MGELRSFEKGLDRAEFVENLVDNWDVYLSLMIDIIDPGNHFKAAGLERKWLEMRIKEDNETKRGLDVLGLSNALKFYSPGDVEDMMVEFIHCKAVFVTSDDMTVEEFRKAVGI